MDLVTFMLVFIMNQTEKEFMRASFDYCCPDSYYLNSIKRKKRHLAKKQHESGDGLTFIIQ